MDSLAAWLSEISTCSSGLERSAYSPLRILGNGVAGVKGSFYGYLQCFELAFGCSMRLHPCQHCRCKEPSAEYSIAGRGSVRCEGIC